MGHRFFGSSLTLAKDETFKVEWGGCTDEGIYNGTYNFDGKILTLTWDSSTEKVTDHNGNPREKESSEKSNDEKIKTEHLIPIRWDTRVYLIPEDQIIEFCNAVNAGVEPNLSCFSDAYMGSFYLRDSDIEKNPDGLPELPEEFQAYILAKPLRGKIISIKNTKDETIVTINIGSKKGLKLGMRIMLGEEEPSVWSGKVNEVKGNVAKVKASYAVEIGNIVSTQYQGPKLVINCPGK